MLFHVESNVSFILSTLFTSHGTGIDVVTYGWCLFSSISETFCWTVYQWLSKQKFLMLYSVIRMQDSCQWGNFDVCLPPKYPIWYDLLSTLHGNVGCVIQTGAISVQQACSHMGTQGGPNIFQWKVVLFWCWCAVRQQVSPNWWKFICGQIMGWHFPSHWDCAWYGVGQKKKKTSLSTISPIILGEL